MSLVQLHHDPDTPRLALVLALVLLVQALLPAQTHTRVVAGPDGIAWQLCTLAGAPQDPEHPGRDSAALHFSQLAAELLPGTAPAVPVAGWNAGATRRPAIALPALSETLRRNNIRAPPAAATFTT